jgi:molybdopterin-containing oxidoreductase family membrane subunit
LVKKGGGSRDTLPFLIFFFWLKSKNKLYFTDMAFNPGKNNPKVLVPACIFLFLGIWIEKGIGLIVPGLVPSPLGEVVDYAPSWVEICVTLGILALGIFVVTLLVKPALKIEQRFESYQRSESD